MIKKTIISNLQDARWQLLIFLLCYSIIALYIDSFTRSPFLLFSCLITSFLIDYIFTYLTEKKYFSPISSVITGVGIFLLCDSSYIYIYQLVILLSISSKYLIKVNNQHIYNPSNFGIAICLLFFENSLTVSAGNWGGNIFYCVVISILGLILSKNAKRVYLVLSFLLFFIFLGFVRSFVIGAQINFILAPLLGPSFYLFLFYMLTDPKVTPKSNSAQIRMGCFIAVIDASLRVLENKYAPFYSLFIVLSIYPSLDSIQSKYNNMIQKKSPKK